MTWCQNYGPQTAEDLKRILEKYCMGRGVPGPRLPESHPKSFQKGAHRWKLGATLPMISHVLMPAIMGCPSNGCLNPTHTAPVRCPSALEGDQPSVVEGSLVMHEVFVRAPELGAGQIFLLLWSSLNWLHLGHDRFDWREYLSQQPKGAPSNYGKNTTDLHSLCWKEMHEHFCKSWSSGLDRLSQNDYVNAGNPRQLRYLTNFSDATMSSAFFYIRRASPLQGAALAEWMMVPQSTLGSASNICPKLLTVLSIKHP